MKTEGLKLDLSLIQALESAWLNVLSYSSITKELAFSEIEEKSDDELRLLQEEGRRILLHRIKNDFVTDNPVYKGTSHEKNFERKEFIAVTSLLLLFETCGFSFSYSHIRSVRLSYAQKEKLCRFLENCTGKGPCTDCGGSIDWNRRRQYNGIVFG